MYGQHTQFWFDATIQKNWNERWSLLSDGGIRFQVGSGLNVAYLRSGVGYELSENTTVQAGLAYFYYSPETGNHFQEARPWQGLRFKIPLTKKIDFINYFRLEERIFYYTERSAFFLRFRYLTGLTITLYQQENFSVYTPLYVEFFEDLNDHQTIFINHQRWYVGIGFTFLKSKAEVYYIARESRISTEHLLDITENIWRVRWYFTL